MLVTLFEDCSIYFWNLQSFEPDYKMTDAPEGLRLSCMDYSLDMKQLVVGGQTPFILLYNTTEFFVDKHPRRQAFRLPKGYYGVSKVKFLNDNQHIALLTEGALLVV